MHDWSLLGIDSDWESSTATVHLKQHEAELKGLGVKHLYLFGSTARGDARPDSDVDLFFDYEKGALGLFQARMSLDGRVKWVDVSPSFRLTWRSEMKDGRLAGPIQAHGKERVGTRSECKTLHRQAIAYGIKTVDKGLKQTSMIEVIRRPRAVSAQA